VTQPRRYSSTLRDEQVRLTRRRVLDAARQLFLAKGYVGTTIEAVAGAAGVSVQTVYNVVGGKPKLVKAVYDVTLAGDDEPVPMAGRPEYLALMAETDPARFAGRYIDIAIALQNRLGPLLAILTAQAAAGDRDLQEFVRTIDNERATGTTMLVRAFAERFGLRPGLTVARAVDLVWALISPDAIDRLLVQRGWAAPQVTKWMSQVLLDLLQGPG